MVVRVTVSKIEIENTKLKGQKNKEWCLGSQLKPFCYLRGGDDGESDVSL